MGKTNTIDWHWGAHDIIDFDAKSDVLDFGWFGANNFTVSEQNGSCVISIPSNNQTYTLKGVTLSALSLANIVAKDASAVSVWEKALAPVDAGSAVETVTAPSTATSSAPAAQSTPTTVSEPVAHNGSSDAATHAATVTTINWSWGSHATLAFDPATDKLDFGWISANNFKIAEVSGSVVITIPSNDQSYTLSGVSLSQLTAGNIVGKDASALAAWSDAFGGKTTQAAETGSETTGTTTATSAAPATTAPAQTQPASTVPVTTTEPATTETSHAATDKAAYTSAWEATSVYNGGDLASVGNSVYKAKWWTSGDDPATHSGTSGGSVWSFVGYMDTTPVAPDAPAHLQAVGTSSASAVLSWDAAEIHGPGKITGYNIYENDALVATTNDTYFKITGLNPSTEYKFSVAAVDEAGTSQHSNAIDVTTRAEGAAGVDKSFSPYIDMSITSSQHVVDMVSKAGLSGITFAFLQSSGTDQVGWGGSGSIQQDALSNGATISSIINKLHSSGVDVTISFGGAVGQEAAATASSAQALTATYQSVIDKYHVTHLDFDIEGAAIANTAVNATRDIALAALEKANPDLKVSFTLPVLTDGLTLDGIKLLQSAKDAGVHVDTVNIMAMDYGANFDTGDMGRDAISAAEATLKQIAKIGLDSHLVITPMIGINDTTSEVFTLANAQHLVDYVQSNDKVDGIAMWSLGRDNGSSVGSVSPTGSGLTQDDLAFSKVFNTVHAAPAHNDLLL